ncbi:uncharacterized protein LOC143885003 isoform X2 [Tasmannia lanceolata]|uniref:uncharacterized protein LOC143885003 isoform X2 n=1 Tax=Tasmannia lanceolata TaxID=3420 RepID=UPI0040636A60
MPPFSSTIANQIRFLLDNVNDSNYDSIFHELCQFVGCGHEGSILLLQTCLDQVIFHDGDMQNIPLKPDLLAATFRFLMDRPNFSTVYCESLRNTVMTEGFLGDLSKALHLSTSEKLGIGLALSDSENLDSRLRGQNFCMAQIELCLNPTFDVSHEQIQNIVMFLSRSQGLAKHVDSFMKMLSLIKLRETPPFVLAPMLIDDLSEVNSLRNLNLFYECTENDFDAVLAEIEKEMSMADIMKELGYGCTANASNCKEMLSLFSPLNEAALSRILGTIARTYVGLEDSQSTYVTFSSALGSSSTTDPSTTDSITPDSSRWSSWNIDVLVDCIKQLNPETNWTLVMENLDHEEFYFPDEEAFSFFMSIYAKACPDPFPLHSICGSVWKNAEGQLSFLKYAISAPPEIFTFAHSSRQLSYVDALHGDKLPRGNANQAWLCLDLLEVLCQLAERGHASSVRKMLEFPLKHCPDVLLVGMAHINTAFNLLQYEVSSTVFPMIIGNATRRGIIHFLWHVSPSLVLRGFIAIHNTNPNIFSRIFDICRELKILSLVLDMTPFTFSIKLAVFVSWKEHFNLDKWLDDNLSIYKDAFFEECLKFLKEIILDVANDVPDNPFQHSGISMNLYPETSSTFFKILQANSGQLISCQLPEELKRLQLVSLHANTKLQSGGATDSSAAVSYPPDIDDEANSYFQQMFSGQLAVDAMVQKLTHFKESSERREQSIFECMIANLFEEYRHFPKYPERQLIIAAVFFGSLIKHQLVSHLTLGIALRCILDALRKSDDSKMFVFGAKSLEQFVDRLVEWPQYCNHILQISHLRGTHADLVAFIERALVRISSGQSESNGGGSAPNDQHRVSTPQATLENMEVQQRHQGFIDDRHKASATSVSYMKPLLSSTGQLSVGPTHTDLISSQKASASQVVQLMPLQHPASRPTTVSPSPGFLRPSQGMTSAGMLRQHSYSTGFGSALNIETLVAAAERRDTPIEAPGSEIQDKILFMINNISATNIDAKAKEFTEVLKEQYFPWFAQYMVMKRASIEPNFHDLYLKFIDKINSKVLNKEIVKASYENCKALLRSDLIKSSSEERSLLKNLGSWLGKFTIGRNQVLLAREIDPKVLIIEAYEKGLMIAVIPFTSKVLEPCQGSLAYRAPNPWTMAILGLLAEIYALPNLKMNLKFDIEVLFKNLGVDMKDVEQTSLLKDRVREIEGNPDFSNKENSISHPQTITEANSGIMSALSQVQLQPEVAKPSHPCGHSNVLTQVHTFGEDDKMGTLNLSERLSSGQGLSQVTPSQSPQLPTQAPNIGTHVVDQFNALRMQLQFQRIVPMAVEGAIKEILSLIVKRSATIACHTTRELVLKDYAMESDENRIYNAAHLMMASLAGSLARVTCKEPLRVAMRSHLHSLLQGLCDSKELFEEAVKQVTNDHLDLGCALIKQAAIEKVSQDIDGDIAPSVSFRRKQRVGVSSSFYDASTYTQSPFSRVPEALRPKPGRLSIAQQRVYEDFVRFPWQNQSSQSSNAEEMDPVSALLSASTHVGASDGIIQHGTDVNGAASLFPSIVAATEQHSMKPSNAVKELGSGISEPLLTTADTLDKYHILAQKLETFIAKDGRDAEIQGVIAEVPEIILRCVSRDEVSLAIVQKVFKSLYENASNSLHIASHLAILVAIRDVCKLVVKELTSWVIYSDEERKFNKDVTVGLIRSKLLNLAEYNVHLAKLIDGGRNKAATEFAISLVQTLVFEGPGASVSELYNLIDALAKLALRPGSPESLQQLVEIARNPTANAISMPRFTIGNDDKSKQSMDKNVARSVGIRDYYSLTESTGADHSGFREQVSLLFTEWCRISELPGATDTVYTHYISQLNQSGLLKGDDITDRFFRILTELSVAHCLASEGINPAQHVKNLSFIVVDMYAKLVVLVIKYCAVDQGVSKIILLPKILSVTVRAIQKDAEEKKSFFNPRPYFRLFVNWLLDFGSPDPVLDGANFQVLTSFANAFHALQPLKVPGWSFAWLELVSHRSFMPKLLMSNSQMGWSFIQRLLVDLFKFMEPYLRNAELIESVHLLYRGTLRVLLVLLHDFPEFLCDYHLSLCDVIPSSCIQMRNVILSAFPRNMRLPDPSTPNLKIDLLPEIGQSPHILSEIDAALKVKQIKADIDEYLKTRQQGSSFLAELKQRLLLPQSEASLSGTRYNVPLINSLVIYVGVQAIQQLQSKSTAQDAPTPQMTHTASMDFFSVGTAMDIFQTLIGDLDTEGRYLFLNAVANQLRYPNNHTHYFSFMLLYLFVEAKQEIIQEQITRVLLERLIVNRPHPWGLLITFIELIKNRRYNFWSRSFIRCAPEIENLFESVSRSCGAKAVDDGMMS